MQIRSALNGGLCEVDEEFGAKLIESGQWVAAEGYVPPVTSEAVKPKRTRRTKAQIAADQAAALAAEKAATSEE